MSDDIIVLGMAIVVQWAYLVLAPLGGARWLRRRYQRLIVPEMRGRR